MAVRKPMWNEPNLVFVVAGTGFRGRALQCLSAAHYFAGAHITSGLVGFMSQTTGTRASI
jgi:hypothetical protein